MLSVHLLGMIMATSLFYKKNSVTIARLTTLSLLYSAILTCHVWLPQTITTGLALYNGLLQVSSMTSYFELLVLFVGSLILLAFFYSKELENNGVALNYCYLILFSLAGSCFLITSTNFITLFLAIELQSFAVYVLAGLYKDSYTAISSSLKYFLIGALSSTLILLGSALVYSNTGLIYFNDIFYLSGISQDNILTLGGLFILVGLLAKIAVAPFHYWAPDVYDGVPTVVTLYLTLLPKLSILCLLIEIFITTNNTYFYYFIIITASFSLIIGSILGLQQTKIKRLLTYSTISHLAYIIIPLSGLSFSNLSSLLFYITQYTLTNLNAFFVLIAMGYWINNSQNQPTERRTTSRVAIVQRSTDQGADKDIHYIKELTTIVKSNPTLALIFTICLFSFSGIPPLAGFFGKYYVLLGVIEQKNYFFVLLAIITSIISAIYYLSIIKICFTSIADTDNDAALDKKVAIGRKTAIQSLLSYTISILTNFIVLIFFVPQLLLKSVKWVALTQLIL